MANQNFRVGVSADVTAARTALRRLEADFKDIKIDFNSGTVAVELQKVERAIQGVDKSFGTLNTKLTNLSERFRTLDRAADPVNTKLRDIKEVINDFDTDADRAADNMRQLARAIASVDRALNKMEPERREQQFESMARGVERLRRAFATSDDDAAKLSREIRDLADASRTADRATDSLGRSVRRVSRTAIGPAGIAARSGGSPFGFVGASGPLGFLGIGGVGAGAAIGAGVIAGISALAFGIASAAAATGRFVVATSQLSAEFDRLIRTANVLAGGDALGIFSEAALREGARTIFTASEAAEALGELARAGFDTEEAIGALPGVLDLAAIEQANLADTTLIVARTLRAFQLDAEAASVVADVLAETSAASATSVTELSQGLKFVAPVASQLEIPLQEVAAAMGVLGDNGIVATIAGTNLRFALNSLLAPSAPAAAAMEELALVTTDAAGNFVGLEAIINQLADAQERIGDNARFNALVVEAFGTRASGAILTLVENSELLNTRIGENFRSFGRAAEIAQEQLAGLEGALERLRGEFEAQQITSFRATGLQDSLTAAVGAAEDALPALFDALVDPIFNEIAVGVNLLRTEVFPSIIDAAPEFGEIFGDTIASVFNFITTNDDFVIESLEALANAAQGVVDLFIGLGVVAETVFGPMITLFNDAGEALQGFLVGGLAGGGIGTFLGGVLGLAGGPGGALVGAGIGAAVGSLAGGVAAALGAAFGESSVQRQAAEFGVELGTSINEGVERGLDLPQALDQALRDTEFGIDVSGFADLVQLRADLVERVAELQAVTTGAAQNIRDDDILSAIDKFESVGVTLNEAATGPGISEAFRTVRDEMTVTAEQAEIAAARIAQALADPDVDNLIEQEIAKAQAIVEDFQSRGITDFSVTLDRAGILERIIAGHPLSALVEATEEIRGRSQRILPVEAARADEILRDFSNNIIRSAGTQAQRIAAEVGPQILQTVEILEGFGASISEVLTSLGTTFIPSEFAIPDPLEFFAGDFTDVFTPPSPDEAERLAEEAATEAEKFIEPSVESAREALIAKLSELPEGIRNRALNNIDRIFEDEGLSLFEQSIAGAFVVDQATLEEQARIAADQLTTVFDRIQELTAEAAEGETLAGVIPSLGLSDAERVELQGFVADQSERTQALRDQAAVLAELAGSGQTVLANVLATNDSVLTGITNSLTRVDDIRAQIQTIADETDVEIGILLSDQSVIDAQTQMAELGTTLAEDGAAVGSDAGTAISGGLEEAVAGIPDIISDPFSQAITDVAGVLDSGSPSRVFIGIGGDMAEGLQIGWDAGFGAFRLSVLTDFSQLLITLRSLALNFTIPPIGGSGVTPPSNVLHSGGFVGGAGESLARVMAGEFMLRKSAVNTMQAMGVSLDLLNRNPRTYFPAPVTQNSSASTTYDHSQHPVQNVTHNWQVNTGGQPIDEKKLIREAERRLVRSVRGRVR